jgi:hypothetical protein
MRGSILLATAFLALPTAEAAAKRTEQASVGLKNGIWIAFSVEGLPGGSSAYAYHSDTIARGFTDLANCSYFGYEIAVKPADDGKVQVSLGPLGAKGELHVRRQLLREEHASCTSPRAIGAPRFPPPSLLADGEGLSIDLLANPRTGATVTDRIRVSRRSFGMHGGSDRPARDLRIEELPFGVSPTGQLRIDGEEQPRSGCGSRGTLVYFWLPRSRERFVFSLVAREGFDFRKVGVADLDRITFTWDGVRYEWVGQEPVVGPLVRCPVWVMKDDREPLGAARFSENDALVCGAGGPEFVLKGR